MRFPRGRRVGETYEASDMQKLMSLLSLTMLLTAVAAAGMWDLPEGTWVAKVGNPYGFFEMEVGTPESKSLTLVYGERSKDSRKTVLRGRYKVLANKGDIHFSWRLEEVAVTGRGPSTATLGSLDVASGDEISGVFTFEGDSVVATFFDGQSQKLLTRRCSKK